MPASLITPVQLPQFARGNQVAAIASPGQYYLAGSENLQITIFNSLPGVAVTMQGRVVDSKGEPKPIDNTFTPTADRMASTFRLPAGECLVSNIIVFASSGSPRVGQTFVQVNVIQGLEGAVKPRATLIQGYVTEKQTRAFPGSPIENSLDGGGYTRVVVGTQPAAGADISESVPTGARWELISTYVGWVGSGAGAPRESRLLLSQSANDFAISPIPDPLPIAGLTIVNWAQGYNFPAALVANVINAVLPFGVSLLAGATIRTQTAAIDPADQWQIPRFLVREWIEAT